MKKISLFIPAICIIVISSAQHLSVGLKGGLSLSDLNNTNIYQMRYKEGFYGGVFLQISLSSLFYLQTEAIYSVQGAKYTTNDEAKHTVNLNCINFPLYVQYAFKEKIRLQTGPQAEFLLDVNDKVKGVETGFFTSQDFKTVNFSWSTGIFYLNNSGLGFDGSYNLGINNISNGGPNMFKNTVFQLGVFYMLNSAHKATSARKGY